MGLTISHDTWDGAYSAFYRWRIKVAEIAGLPPLQFMQGFWNPDGFSYCMGFNYLKTNLEKEAKTRGPDGDYIGSEFINTVVEAFPLKWDALKPDPLHQLLHHSDCDGEIAWEDCKDIADRLEEINESMPDEPTFGHIGNYRTKTATFIEGLRLAHDSKENLEFY